MVSQTPMSPLAERIDAAMKATGKTAFWLHQTTGIPYTTLHRNLYTPEGDFKVSQVQRIAEALDWEFNSLITEPTEKVAS